MPNNLIVDLDSLEPLCIAMRSRTAIIFCYPICKEVLKTGCKVLSRDGRVVKKVRTGTSAGQDVYVGILDGEELKWDSAGRYAGPYKDTPNDLFVPERYFYQDWKTNIGMSNSEWAVKFGRPHPTVAIPYKSEN